MSDTELITDSQKLDKVLAGQERLEKLVCDPNNPQSHHARIIRMEERTKYILAVAMPLGLGLIATLIKIAVFS